MTFICTELPPHPQKATKFMTETSQFSNCNSFCEKVKVRLTINSDKTIYCQR